MCVLLLLLLLFRECGTYGDGALVTLATPGVGLAVLGDLNTAFPTQSPVSGEQDTARVSVSSREVTLHLPLPPPPPRRLRGRTPAGDGGAVNDTIRTWNGGGGGGGGPSFYR